MKHLVRSGRRLQRRRSWVEPLESRLLMAAIVKHAPYLQLGNAPLSGFDDGTDQVEVIWQTVPQVGGTTTESFAVDYRPAGGGSWLSVSLNAPIITGVGGRVNLSATLADLAFDTAYEYRVQHLEDAAIVETFQAPFRTRLPKGNSTPFSFAAYGDSACGTPSCAALANFRNVQTRINATDAAFSLLLGDNVYDTGTHPELDARFDHGLNLPAAQWIRSHVDYWANGNHDDDAADARPSRENFSTPIPVAGVTSPVGIAFDNDVGTNGLDQEENYSFDYGDVHFVTLDSNQWDNPATLTRALDWAAADISAAGARWNVVFVHHPIATRVGHAELNPGANYCQQVIARLGPSGAGADMLLAGHAHNYQRSYPLTGFSGSNATFVLDTDNDYAEGAGLVQVVVGTGGHSVGQGGTNATFQNTYVAKGLDNGTSPVQVQFGFLKIDVSPALGAIPAKLTAQYIAAATGNVLDSFTITDTPDVIPPQTALTTPLDNGPGDLDSDVREVLTASAQSLFTIQLTDVGDGVDDATVVPSVVALRRNGVLLTQGIDYHFAYAPITDRISLTPVSNAFGSGSYIVDLNAGAARIRDRASLELAATQFQIAINTSLTPTQLVPQGAVWKYLDNGSNQGTAWRSPTFDDSLWAAGPAELGYGDGGEATTVDCGPGPPTDCNPGNSSSGKYVTTCFRRTFTVESAAGITGATLGLVRDDGAVVYLNGVEVVRTNLPAAPASITSTTLASSAIGGADESTFLNFTIPTAAFVDGANVLAVEIHQSASNSSDLSFNARLSATLINVPPNSAESGGPYALVEGDGVALAASATDPNVADILFFDWDLNGDLVFGDVAGRTPTLTWAQLTALGINDGPATFAVRVRVDDGNGGVRISVPGVLQVTDRAPSIIATGAGHAGGGGPYQLIIGPIQDPGNDHPTGIVIDWGDGNSDHVTPGTGTTTHVYPRLAATRQVSIHIVDEDGLHENVRIVLVKVRRRQFTPTSPY